MEVPLGTTEDRLLGSVNAEELVENRKWSGRIGLLEEAHGGVLYIDEINLLPDHLADHILDSAASGRYRMERDGFTRSVESRYILVGTMNPDEGDLRPQLSDRFAHGVLIRDDFNHAQRVEIVKRRIAFDDDPEKFVSDFAPVDCRIGKPYHPRPAAANRGLSLRSATVGCGRDRTRPQARRPSSRVSRRSDCPVCCGFG